MGQWDQVFQGAQGLPEDNTQTTKYNVITSQMDDVLCISK